VLVDKKSIGYVPQKLVIDPRYAAAAPARDVVSTRPLTGHRLGFGFPSRQRRELVEATLADGRRGRGTPTPGSASCPAASKQRVLIAAPR